MTEEDFGKRVASLCALDLSPSEAAEEVEYLCDEYRQTTGKEPSEAHLAALSEWLLRRYTTSNNKRHDPYPVYTNEQLAAQDRKHGVYSMLQKDANGDVYNILESVDSSVLDNMNEVRRHIEATAREAKRAKKNDLRVRIQATIKDNPGLPMTKIAKMLGIGRATLYRYIGNTKEK